MTEDKILWSSKDCFYVTFYNGVAKIDGQTPFTYIDKFEIQTHGYAGNATITDGLLFIREFGWIQTELYTRPFMRLD